MRYHFYGDYFRFPMELENLAEVQQIITNCRHGRKVQGNWISRKIRRVINETGEQVYPPKNK